MSAKEDPFGRTPRRDLLSTATHPFSEIRASNPFDAICGRLAGFSSDLRWAARHGVPANDNVSGPADETAAAEEQQT